MRRLVICAAFLAGIATAQGFEVASIRRTEPVTAGQQTSQGIHIDGAQFQANNMSLKDFLAMGYGVRLYQLNAPDWVANERYNIAAKLPDKFQTRPPSEDEIALMVSKLLEERFQTKSHRDSKDFLVYELVTLKGGIRAKEAPLESPDGTATSVGANDARRGSTFSLGRGAFLSMGDNRIEFKKVSMAVLADVLSRYADRPVLDGTTDKSTYDITLELAPGDFQVALARGAASSGVVLPPQSMRLLQIPTGDSLHEALARVGLKLEAKKAPLDVIVIESINRLPSEN